MADTYKNFSELSRKRREGTDFKITDKKTADTSIAFVAPHGGKIEKGTSKVASGSANGVFCLYLFEGIMADKNKELHITSHHFDEPRALELVAKCGAVIGVHGRKDGGDTETIYLGGLDEDLIELIATGLCNAGFKIRAEGHDFPAKKNNNICNRGISGKGAQIELPYTLRDRLLKEPNKMNRLTNALYRVACEFKD
jgi:phage replication-related protein YjqB (UPF0714/DUF867 family)